MTDTLRRAAQKLIEHLDAWDLPELYGSQAFENLRAALAQPAQKPVAWRELCRRLYVELFHCDQQMMATKDEDGEPMWTQGKTVRDVLADAKEALAQPAQPPRTGNLLLDAYNQVCAERVAQPAQQERKPLTDYDIRKIYGRDMNYRDGDFVRFARAIEAAHGIGSKT